MQMNQIWSSKTIALVAVFAALNIITDSFGTLPTSGVWSSWNFILTSLTGIILGPFSGFASSFIGVMIGHQIYFQGPHEIIFTMGAPIGAAISAMTFKGQYKPVLIYYIALFSAYFVTPIAWQLPIWGMWDTYIAFAILVITSIFLRKSFQDSEFQRLSFKLAIAVLVGLEADILFRIFLLIPCQGYRILFTWNVEILQTVWGGGAIIAPLKVVLAIIATVAIGPPLIKTLRKIGFPFHP